MKTLKVKDGKVELTRSAYKQIKRYDKQEMTDFVTKLYANAFRDGVLTTQSTYNYQLDDILKTLSHVHGIGEVMLGRIKKALMAGVENAQE